MEFLAVALFILIIAILVNIQKTLKSRFDRLDEEMNILRQQLFKKPSTDFQQEAALPPVPEAVISPVTPPVTDVKPEPPPPPKEKSLSDELENLLRNAEREVLREQTLTQEKGEPQKEETAPVAEVADLINFQTAKTPPEPKPSFLERNPDLEKFIGENLISKIGIAILVLAIGFFVKYAIDNDWIGKEGRVGIGILCGAILVYIGHRLRKSYQAFSSVMIGGGLAIFYFTIALAFHQFALFGQTTTFIIMVVITAFAVVLSRINDRQELAIIALVGGFATPIMASNGGGNYHALFIYLIILNAGLLAIAYNKSWRLLNILAFAFTAILFSAWIYSLDEKNILTPAKWGLIYASVFYAMFFLINIAYNIRQNKAFIASDFGILLANNCLYFSAGLYFLTVMEATEYRGLFTAIIAVINLAASYLLFRNRKVDKNILYLLIGITLSFISLTAPIQLNGHNITLFWAAEAVLLFWLYRKSSIQLVRLASMLVWFAMIISLLMDFEKVYGLLTPGLPVITNRGFITGIIAAISSFLLFRLSSLQDQPEIPVRSFPSIGSSVYRIVGLVILYLSGMLEIDHQFSVYYHGTQLNLLYMLLFTYAFGMALYLTSRRNAVTKEKVYFLAILPSVCIAIYIFTVSDVFAIQRNMLYSGKNLMHFNTHWISAAFVAFLIYSLIQTLKKNNKTFEPVSVPATWLICAAIVVFANVESHLAINLIYYSPATSLEKIQRIFIKTGMPIVWGLCSFGFMWFGMKYKFRTLRIVSLSLFLLILLKLFLFDIRNIPVAGKIAAFFSLGVLLLVISFMYQRLKKIIIEDESKSAV